MPRVLVERGPDRGKAVTMTVGGQVVIGRDPAASLQLSDQLSSRRHCMIIGKSATVWGLKDLGSANGTLINGRRMNNAHRLEFGDTIQIGETLMSWLPDEQTDKKGGIIGTEVGGYRIEQRLGRGAMGTVYKATQMSLGRIVALKVLSPDLTKDPRFCDMFLKEARAAGGLNHSNIIQVYDVGDSGGQYFFSMEYAARGSVLEEMNSQKTLPLPRAIQVVKHACAALDYAERKGLVHRDIKPDNLMVTEDMTVKLGDLGLAMSAHEVNAEQDGVFGTPHYIAPEQAMGRPIDHRADIYALGASFYRMVTGRTLFEGATVKEILKQQVRDAHPPVQTHAPDCPPGISTIIDRMLMKNPAERYQHASDIAADLANFELMYARRGQGAGSAFAVRPRGLGAGESQRITQALRTRNLVLAVIAASVALIALIAVLWLFVFDGGGSPVIANGPGPIQAVNAAPEVSEAVLRANEGLGKAIVLAEYQFKEKPDREGCEKALATLDQALRDFPGAGADISEKAASLRGRIKAEHLKTTRSADEVRQAWEAARQEAVRLAEEFKFRGGIDVISQFIGKYGDRADADIQQVMKDANAYLKPDTIGGYAEEGRAIMLRFENSIEQERRRVAGLADAQRKPALIAARQTVRLKRDACDEPVYKDRLDKLAEALDKEVTQLESAGKQQLQILQAEARERCNSRLTQTLKTVSRQVAEGRFGEAARTLADFELKDPDYMAYSGIPEFEGIRNDIARRKDQTALIVACLPALKAALPTGEAQRQLLRGKPWPAEASALLGGPAVTVGLTVNPPKGEGAWALDCISAAGVKTLNAVEFDNNDKRKALGMAMAHLLAHDTGLGPALLRVPREYKVPVGVGVFAWLMEMDAYAEAFPFINDAYRKNEIDSAMPLIKEYYAWGLLARMEVAARAGNGEEFDRLKSDLEQFADTRAYKGRK